MASPRVVFPGVNGDFIPANRMAFAEATFARPADTDVYADGDVISTSAGLGANGYMLFSLPAATGFLEGGIIVDATIINNVVGSPLPLLRLWLFDKLPGFNLNDNAPFTPGFVDLVDDHSIRLDFPTPTTAANVVNLSVHQQLTELVRGFKPSAQHSLLSGVLVVRNAYTPASEEQFHIRLGLAMV
jgi:hypothetical protein